MKKLISILFACTIIEAIQSVRPGAEWSLSGSDYSGLTWLDGKTTKPTRKEITTAISECAADSDRESREIEQAKIDLNTTTKSDAERINAMIKYLRLDK